MPCGRSCPWPSAWSWRHLGSHASRSDDLDPRRAISVTAPGKTPLSISCFMTPAMRSSRSRDMPCTVPAALTVVAAWACCARAEPGKVRPAAAISAMTEHEASVFGMDASSSRLFVAAGMGAGGIDWFGGLHGPGRHIIFGAPRPAVNAPSGQCRNRGSIGAEVCSPFARQKCARGRADRRAFFVPSLPLVSRSVMSGFDPGIDCVLAPTSPRRQE